MQNGLLWSCHDALIVQRSSSRGMHRPEHNLVNDPTEAAAAAAVAAAVFLLLLWLQLGL